MNFFKQSAVCLCVTVWLCLATSSVLAAPTSQGFTSPVTIENTITFSAITNISFGTITAPDSVSMFIIFPDGSLVPPATGSFVSGQSAGAFTVASPSADVVTLTWTPLNIRGAVGVACVASTGTGTAPEMRNLTLGNAVWEADGSQSVAGAGITTTMGATLKVSPDSRNGWDCTYDVSANF